MARDEAGTIEGPEALSEARSAGAPTGVGSGEGCRSLSSAWGFGGHSPRINLNFNMQISESSLRQPLRQIIRTVSTILTNLLF